MSFCKRCRQKSDIRCLCWMPRMVVISIAKSLFIVSEFVLFTINFLQFCSDLILILESIFLSLARRCIMGQLEKFCWKRKKERKTNKNKRVRVRGWHYIYIYIYKILFRTLFGIWTCLKVYDLSQSVLSI